MKLMKFKDYLRNMAINSVPVILFLFGINYSNDLALNISIIAFWIVAIGSLLILIPPKFFVTDQKLIKMSLDENYQLFNIVYDVGVVVMLAWYGFNILAVFYAIHVVVFLFGFYQIKTYLIENSVETILEQYQENLRKSKTEAD